MQNAAPAMSKTHTLAPVSQAFLPQVSRAGEDPMRQSIDERACGEVNSAAPAQEGQPECR